jgi:hypothetical protein
MLKKDIRKQILETKKRKESILIEEVIVKRRLESIFENKSDLKYFNGLSEDKKLFYSVLLIKEIQEMNKVGLINEQFLDILKSLFGGLFGRSAVETIAEPIIGKILSSIGFKSEGIMKKTMVSFLTTNPTRLVNALTDCKEMTKLISESFAEGLIMLLQDQVGKGSFIYDYIRNVLGGTIKEMSAISSFENMIAEKVCGLFDTFTDKAKNVADKLKTQPGS